MVVTFYLLKVLEMYVIFRPCPQLNRMKNDCASVILEWSCGQLVLCVRKPDVLTEESWERNREEHKEVVDSVNLLRLEKLRNVNL